MRPVEIARSIGVSTTTLRHYEDQGLIPPVLRSASGYRIYTSEHLAYFRCIRAMRNGFSLSRITKILKEVLAKNSAAAFWIVTQAQADLHREKIIAEKIMQHLRQGAPNPPEQPPLTIHAVSRETGVPATTIRYWEKVGLLPVKRDRVNNYRLFTAQHIRQILTIYALKFSVYAHHRRYSVERVRAELETFDETNPERLSQLARDMALHLAQVNRAQISGIAALYQLCLQVETGQFEAE